MRFCISDGQAWIFCLFEKAGDGTRIVYEGNPVLKIAARGSERTGVIRDNVMVVVDLLCHWVRPAKFSGRKLLLMLFAARGSH